MNNLKKFTEALDSDGQFELTRRYFPSRMEWIENGVLIGAAPQ